MEAPQPKIEQAPYLPKQILFSAFISILIELSDFQSGGEADLAHQQLEKVIRWYEIFKQNNILTRVEPAGQKRKPRARSSRSDMIARTEPSVKNALRDEYLPGDFRFDPVFVTVIQESHRDAISFSQALAMNGLPPLEVTGRDVAFLQDIFRLLLA